MFPIVQCGLSIKGWPALFTYKDVEISLNMTEDELAEARNKLATSGRLYVATISGCDYDSRELFEIPEAVQLAKRVLSSGFVTVLEFSTTLPTFNTEAYPKWGAFEFWRLANGKMNLEKQVDAADVRQAIEDLQESHSAFA